MYVNYFVAGHCSMLLAFILFFCALSRVNHATLQACHNNHNNQQQQQVQQQQQQQQQHHYFRYLCIMSIVLVLACFALLCYHGS